jgi:phage terminase large subunit-like protein
MDEQRIDIFDAAVFACVRKIEDMEKVSSASKWLNG